MKKIYLLTLLVMICCPVFAQYNSFNGLPVDCRTGSSLSDQWLDGTHYFDNMVDQFIQEHGKPVYNDTPVPQNAKKIGEETSFWTVEMASGAQSFTQVPAVLKLIGKHCYLYVEKGGVDISDATLQKIADRFDDVIYPVDTNTFGPEARPGIDQDDRITLFLVDIKDGWEPGKGYVGGYFFPLNGYSKRVFPQSNEREMIYMDTYPSDPESDFYLGVVAHEFQHLIHSNHDMKEDKWINEGMSQIAFYFCGYGHPSQVFSFLNDTNDKLDHYSNAVIDYGSVYNFFYYIYLHYAGKTIADKQAFFRYLVASPAKSVEGFNQTLKQFKIEKDFSQIYQDWKIANIINRPDLNQGLWGFDQGFQAKVHCTATEFAFPVERTEPVPVNTCATRYIRFASDVQWTPIQPNPFSKLKIYSDGPGKIALGVNGWQQFPSEFLPSGQDSLEFKEDGNLWSLEIGPFYKKNFVVKTIEYRKVFPDGTQGEDVVVKCLGMDMRLIENVEETAGTLNIEFSGKKPSILNKASFIVDAVLELADGNFEYRKYDLDKNNSCSIKISDFGTIYRNVFLMVTGLNGKKLDFTYRATVLKEELSPETCYVHLKDQLLEMKAGNVQDYPAFEDLFLNGVRKLRDLKVQILKSGMDRYEAEKFLIDESTLLDGKITEEVYQKKLNHRIPFTDPVHSSWKFLSFKMNENIHALTHLKIDPVLIEGQIINMYKLLQVSLGLPEIPFPDGLAIKDFDVSESQALLKEWLENPDEADLKGKDVLKRFFVSTLAIEEIYNNSLVLSEMIVEPMYHIVILVLDGNNIIKNICNGLENVPVVGPIAKKVKYRIIDKGIMILRKGADLVAPKIKAPYGTYMPMAVQLLSSLYLHFAKIDQEGSSGTNAKKTITKIIAKYLFASVPKIGYVDRSQKYFDASLAKAKAGELEGNFNESWLKVIDNEGLGSEKSLLQELAITVRNTAALVSKDIQVSNVLKFVSQLAQYVSVIDPTQISKVVAIIGAAGSAGFLSHATYVSGKEYFSLAAVNLKAVNLAFNPSWIDAEPAESSQRTPMKERNLEAYKTALETYRIQLSKVKAALQSKNRDMVIKEFDLLLDRDAELNPHLNIISSFSNSAVKGIEDRNATEISSILTVQSEFYGDMLAQIAGKKILSDPISMNTLSAKLVALTKNHLHFEQDKDPYVFIQVSRLPEIRKGETRTIEITLVNPFAGNFKDLNVKVLSGSFLKIKGTSTVRIASIPPYGKKTITVEVSARESGPAGDSILTATVFDDHGALAPVSDSIFVETR